MFLQKQSSASWSSLCLRHPKTFALNKVSVSCYVPYLLSGLVIGRRFILSVLAAYKDTGPHPRVMRMRWGSEREGALRREDQK